MVVEYYTDGAATMRLKNGCYIRENGGWAFALIKDDKVIYEVTIVKQNKLLKFIAIVLIVLISLLIGFLIGRRIIGLEKAINLLKI